MILGESPSDARAHAGRSRSLRRAPVINNTGARSALARRPTPAVRALPAQRPRGFLGLFNLTWFAVDGSQVSVIQMGVLLRNTIPDRIGLGEMLRIRIWTRGVIGTTQNVGKIRYQTLEVSVCANLTPAAHPLPAPEVRRTRP